MAGVGTHVGHAVADGPGVWGLLTGGPQTPPPSAAWFDVLMNGLPAADQSDVRKAIASTTARKAEHVSAALAVEDKRLELRRALRRDQQSADE